MHLLIHPDGDIWTVDVVESSGSHSLGMPAGRSRPTPRTAEKMRSCLSPRFSRRLVLI